MTLLDASPVLENIYLIICIILALIALATTLYAIWQKLRAGDFKGAAEDLNTLLKQGASTIDQIKSKTSGTSSRQVVQDALRDHGIVLNGLGLKEKMDAKLDEYGLNKSS